MRDLSRREFLYLGAGLLCIPVLAAGCSDDDGNTLPEESTPDVTLPEEPGGLELLNSGYPRAFFFRQTEVQARAGRTPYEAWERRYRPLNGIMGKVLDEAIDTSGEDNVEYFRRYKKDNPEKAVLLHFHGSGRQATDSGATGFFAGHWLYYVGADCTGDIPADGVDAGAETVIGVEDVSRFRLDRHPGTTDDVVISSRKPDGSIDWSRTEQTRLLDVDEGSGTITVERGAYGTKPLEFPAGTYLAPHVMTGPYPDRRSGTSTLWLYNFSTSAPRDVGGRNGGEALAAYLSGLLEPGGDLAFMDGVSLDVFTFLARTGTPSRDIDADADGVAEEGIVDGVDTFAVGTVEFSRLLREILPDKLLTADGETADKLQRSFGYLNGIETEGFPDVGDVDLEDLSRGSNILGFWRENSSSPGFSYVSFKYNGDERDVERNTFSGSTVRADDSYRKLRVVLASAVFADAAFTHPADWSPPGVVWRRTGDSVNIFDELCRGRDQSPNWLGLPSSPTVLLAKNAPDLFEESGKRWDAGFLRRFAGDGLSAVVSGGRVAVRRESVASDVPVLERGMDFTLDGGEFSGEDIFISMKASCDPLVGYPRSVARRVGVRAEFSDGSTGDSFTWVNGRVFESGFAFGGDGGFSLGLDVEGSEPFYLHGITAHASRDARYREFEGGVVFANFSDTPYTFDVQKLFTGLKFFRIEGTEEQDRGTNDGSVIGEELTLSGKDALFVLKG